MQGTDLHNTLKIMCCEGLAIIINHRFSRGNLLNNIKNSERKGRYPSHRAFVVEGLAKL